MKFRLTASSISSIAIKRMMTFLRLRKIPTMLIANSTAPRIRKCESDSKVRLFFLLRRHRNQPHPVAAPDGDLPGRALVLRVLALSERQRDRNDDGHQKQHRRELERIGVVGVEHPPELLGVARARPWVIRPGERLRTERAAENEHHLEYHDEAHRRAQRQVAPESLPQALEGYVEHHHPEEGQHHDV